MEIFPGEVSRFRAFAVVMATSNMDSCVSFFFELKKQGEEITGESENYVICSSYGVHL